MIGSRLGQFEVVEKIGAGGMGVVYRAHDHRLRRDVAIKLLPEGLLQDEAARRRFRREAHALSRLNHPNVETVHAFDTQGDVDFLVLELVPGITLDEMLAGGARPENELVELGIQLARGLAAAHERGVIHLDLKPANLKLTPDGRLKILDFGLARLARNPQETGTASLTTESHYLAGTLAYMAPELFTGQTPDARTDLYAAGAVLYELASGRRAFDKPFTAEMIYAIVNLAPRPLREANPGISPPLESVITKAMQRNPMLRHASASELATDLERLRGTGSSSPSPRRRRFGFTPSPVAFGWLLVVALAVTSLMLWSHRERGARPGAVTALAVLPFENLSRDPAQEFFADGMTDELITSLANLQGVGVIARGSVIQYKGTHERLDRIARELHVDAVVEGSVLRAGDEVRISVRLIRPRDDRTLWADSYRRPMRDVLGLQSEVSQAIVDRIHIQLRPHERRRLAVSRAVDPQAYEAYLRGRLAWELGSAEGFRKALEYFGEAIRLDPAYAPSYAGLANAYSGLSGPTMPEDEAMPRARAAATRALELDSTLGEAHAALGWVAMSYYWDWKTADREFRRAVELSPNSSSVWLWYGFYLRRVGQSDRDREATQKARTLDPHSSFAAQQSGWVEYFARRYDAGVREFRAQLKVQPESFMLHSGLGLCYLGTGDSARALSELRQDCQTSDNDLTCAFLGNAYGRLGHKREAHDLLAKLTNAATTDPRESIGIAFVYLGLGDKDAAFRWFQKATETRHDWLAFLRVDPRLDPLRGDPRYAELMKRLGFETGG